MGQPRSRSSTRRRATGRQRRRENRNDPAAPYGSPDAQEEPCLDDHDQGDAAWARADETARGNAGARRRPRRLGRALSSGWTSPRLTLQADHNHLVVQAVNPTRSGRCLRGSAGLGPQPYWSNMPLSQYRRARSQGSARPTTGEPVGKRQRRIRARSAPGPVAEATKEQPRAHTHRPNRPAPLRSPKKAPVPGLTAHYATRTGPPLKRIFMP